jgi:FeS assembly SUF system protein
VVSKEDIIAALKTVYDPEIPVNIWDLGLVYDIELRGAECKLRMTMTSPTCPMADEIVQMVKNAVLSLSLVDSVDIELVWNPPWDISRMSEQARLELDLTSQGW